ncbi:metal-dependent hydrolase [uncultured Rothia sp.]|uniref:metal-dependent hydrolase n=1 Tax=uncultured Rothia sp. TaxID=316088 RepID=UPI0025D53A4F|nr:metal-dependent hydrolase [uncultured Rothia sp.]
MNANNIPNGNISNGNIPNSGYDTPPPIRNEYDVLSCALHQHGYWPDHSLIILTATDDTLGPSLRVNLPGEPCTLPERADFLHETFAKLPTCHNGETLTRFYAVIVDGDNTVRQRQLHPNTAQLAAIEEIQQDVDTQIPINAWLHLLHDPRIVSELRCEDVIYAGGASIWALNPEQQALTLLAPIEEIRHSSYYTWLTRHGDTIADTAQHNYAHSPWDTDPTTNPETRHDWENAVELWDNTRTNTVQNDEARHTDIRTIYRQAQIDLCYWDAAINAAAHLLTTHPVNNADTDPDCPTIGDALRELIPAEVAGHLRASTAPVTLNPITPEMLTYLAGYGLNHAQKMLAHLHYSAQYTYHAFGGEYPSTSPNFVPLEPPHYGTRITRKTYIPASFTHALSATAGTEQAHVRAVPEKCVQWQDWIRRTHRSIQQANPNHWALQELSPADHASAAELNTISRDLLPRLDEHPNDHNAQNKLENLKQRIDESCTTSEYITKHHAVYTHYLNALKGKLDSPHWARLNALELLTSLLTPHSTDGEYAALRNTQAWTNWYKGYSTYARLLRQEAHRHTSGKDLNILDVHLNAGNLPAWIKHTICGEPGTHREPISTLKPRKP